MASLNPEWITMQEDHKNKHGYYRGYDILVQTFINNKDKNLSFKLVEDLTVNFYANEKLMNIPGGPFFFGTDLRGDNIIWGRTKIFLFIENSINLNKNYCTCNGPNKIIPMFTSIIKVCKDCGKDKR